MAVERAVVSQWVLTSNIGTGFSCNTTVHYIREGALDVVVIAVFDAPIPLNSSPREILEAIIDMIIAEQPAGFNLTPRDIILPSLERG